MDHSQKIIDICKRGIVSKSEMYSMLQKWADALGQPGESSAQRFARAFAEGPNSRVERATEILAALNKLCQRQAF